MATPKTIQDALDGLRKAKLSIQTAQEAVNGLLEQLNAAKLDLDKARTEALNAVQGLNTLIEAATAPDPVFKGGLK